MTSSCSRPRCAMIVQVAQHVSSGSLVRDKHDKTCVQLPVIVLPSDDIWRNDSSIVHKVNRTFFGRQGWQLQW